MAEREIEQICLIANTGEYLKSRAEQFERLFRKTVDQKWKEKVDLNAEITEIKSKCDYNYLQLTELVV